MRMGERVSIARSKTQCPKSIEHDFVESWKSYQVRCTNGAIVTLFDWCADSDRPWYISELGDPFDRWWSQLKTDLREDPSTLVDRAVSVLVELSSALSTCHSHGVVHRDIKPKNLVVKRGVAEPWPILIDFGLAHVETGIRLTPADQAVGNARYSPDIMRNRLEQVPPWLDVFDLAQLFIGMLDDKAPKDHWQRPVHWKYAVYSDGLPGDLELSHKSLHGSLLNSRYFTCERRRSRRTHREIISATIGAERWKDRRKHHSERKTTW